MLAAPLLLLRSETSIAEGLRRLGAYLDPEAQNRAAARMKTRWVNITMNFATIVFLGLIGYFWSWLDSSFGLSVWAILIVLITAFVGAIVLFVGASFYGDPDQGSLSAPISEVVFLPFFVAGMFLRTLSIRVVATMSHPLQGLAQLPLNWRETVAVIDLCHLPELLPRAGTINQKLTMAGLLAAPSSRLSIAIGYKPVLALLMYLPAVLYRWNLKASAWLWWPLASMITPPYRGQTETERYEVVGQTSKG